MGCVGGTDALALSADAAGAKPASGGGQAGYNGGFVEHYLLPIIYPAGLTPQIQIGLGVFVLLLNGLIYGVLLWQHWRRP
jgi:hypothetical protein